MPHFPSYYHREHSHQVEQLRSDIHSDIHSNLQTFQDKVLDKMREISKKLDREFDYTREIASEVSQMHKQIDALVMHLLPPELPLQKIKEALKEIAEYHEMLQKIQHSLDNKQYAFYTEIARLSSAFTALAPIRPDTDKLPIPELEKGSGSEAY
jgi:uncharacterized coiled-coil DUF342 family protein